MMVVVGVTLRRYPFSGQYKIGHRIVTFVAHTVRKTLPVGATLSGLINGHHGLRIGEHFNAIEHFLVFSKARIIALMLNDFVSKLWVDVKATNDIDCLCFG